MKWGNKLQTNILLALCIIWIIALFIAYLPTSGTTTPTFPLAVDQQYKNIFFIASTGFVSVAFFVKGFSQLRKPS